MLLICSILLHDLHGVLAVTVHSTDAHNQISLLSLNYSCSRETIDACSLDIMAFWQREFSSTDVKGSMQNRMVTARLLLTPYCYRP